MNVRASDSLTVESEGDGLTATTLAGTVDQAALQGLLRRLYSLGLPLISVWDNYFSGKA